VRRKLYIELLRTCPFAAASFAHMVLSQLNNLRDSSGDQAKKLLKIAWEAAMLFCLLGYLLAFEYDSDPFHTVDLLKEI
jgi:hypothetical protein